MRPECGEAKIRGRAGAPPGPYEIVLTVKDEAKGTTVEDREPFTLGPAPETATAERR